MAIPETIGTSDTPPASPVTRSAAPARAVRLAALPWRWAALGTILLAAGGLNVWQLAGEGYANTYYAAAVKSMLTSWHNFFFASFDSGGFVAVDKPPLGLWVQAASAKVFGFSGLSMLLPEALAGVLAVALLYVLVARAWGSVAGLLAALALALTPISVVVDRNNTIDSLLILTLLGAAWAALRGVETGRLRWLLLCAVLVGLGFNIKMLEAYLIVPALGLAYLLGAPLRWRSRLGGLALAALVLLVVSLSWSLAVDLTPAAARPYVSDSGTNSELSLALGYNGLGRVTTALFGGLQSMHILGSTIALNIMPAFAPEIGDPSVARLVSGVVGAQASWLLPLAILGGALAALAVRRRLPLDRQGRSLALWGGWLLAALLYFSFSRFYHLYYLSLLAPAVAALAGLGAVALWRAYRTPGWRGWALPLTLLATAALQVHLLSSYPDWSAWLTPLVLASTLLAAAALTALRLYRVLRRASDMAPRASLPVALAAMGLALLALFVAPATWTAISLADGNGAAWLPQAGPSQGAGSGGGPGRFSAGGRGGAPFGGGFGQGRFGGGGRPSAGGQPSGGPGASGGFGFPGGAPGGAGNGFPFGGGQGRSRFGGGFGGFRGGGGQGAMTFAGAQANALDPALVRYLLAHQGKARFLVATTTSAYASLFMLDTSQPAMALGGYQGWDRILTPAQLAHLVSSGVVRYFYLPAFGGFSAAPQPGAPTTASGSTDQTGDLTQWVRATCAAVPSAQWQSSSASIAAPFGQQLRGGRGNGMQLYACKG